MAPQESFSRSHCTCLPVRASPPQSLSMQPGCICQGTPDTRRCHLIVQILLSGSLGMPEGHKRSNLLLCIKRQKSDAESGTSQKRKRQTSFEFNPPSHKKEWWGHCWTELKIHHGNPMLMTPWWLKLSLLKLLTLSAKMDPLAAALSAKVGYDPLFFINCVFARQIRNAFFNDKKAAYCRIFSPFASMKEGVIQSILRNAYRGLLMYKTFFFSSHLDDFVAVNVDGFAIFN